MQDVKVDDVEVVGLKEHFPQYKDRDYDIVDIDCYVNWRYDLDVRSWGIKDISIYTTSVYVSVTVEIYDEEYTKVEVEKEIELMVDDMGGFSSDEEGKWHYEDQMSDELFSHSVLKIKLLFTVILLILTFSRFNFACTITLQRGI